MKQRNRLVWIGIAALLAAVLTLAPAAESAPQDTAYVTIADENGELALVREAVVLEDADGDGAVTVNDALLLAHEQAYPGGAAAGYLSSEGPYGLKLDKLWGVENGGSYGYYVNHASAMSLTAPVSDGDEVAAFIYTDLDGYSDTYCYFDRATVELNAPGELTLTLKAAGWAADYNPVELPVADAVIVVNGEKTDFRTDENGSVTLNLAAGSYIISAVSDAQVLVPPVCQVSVAGDAGSGDEETGDANPSDTEQPADTEPGSGDGQADSETDPTELYAILVLAGVALLAAVVDGIVHRKKDR